MADAQINLSGGKGLLAAAGVVVLVLIRLFTLGESDDPALHAAIRAHLMNDLGGNLGKALEDFDPGDPQAVSAILERADATGIKLHSVKVSKPVLSFGSTTKAIIYCEFTLPGEGRESVYWRFSDQMIGGWRYRGGSSAASYYLNFF